MADPVRLRVRHKTKSAVLEGFTSNSKLSELKKAIEQKTGVLQCNQVLLSGYPPKELRYFTSSATLREAGIKSADIIIVNEIALEERRIRDVQQRDGAAHRTAKEGEFLREQVASNNSCLFQSVGVLVDGGITSSGELRQVVAGVIASDPSTYTSTVLEQDRTDYIKWIQLDTSWGGAIELCILSEYFHVELDVVDVQTLRIDKFGHGKGYSDKAYMIYNGIHYDPLLLKKPNGEKVGRLPCSDDHYSLLALQVAKDLHNAEDFVDLSSFSLRCLECNKLLTGQRDAIQHAQQTKHNKFGEVSKK